MMKNVPDSCCQMEIPFELVDVESLTTVGQLERNMGKPLVEVYLKTCTPFERTLLGRDRPLTCPGDLWISPDDRCKGDEVRLTPVKTESVQALTHQGILEIGKRIEKQLEETKKKDIEEAVEEARELAK